MSAGQVGPRKRKPRPKLPASERATLSIEEAADYLGIGRQTAYDEAKTGGLPVVRLGRRKKRILVVRALLDEMLLRQGRAAWTTPAEPPKRRTTDGLEEAS
jgi:excisionase family DNA binding protein